MTSRLKKKLTDIGVDVSSRKANENFCLVREFMLFFQCTVDSTPGRLGHLFRRLKSPKTLANLFRYGNKK